MFTIGEQQLLWLQLVNGGQQYLYVVCCVECVAERAALRFVCLSHFVYLSASIQLSSHNLPTLLLIFSVLIDWVQSLGVFLRVTCSISTILVMFHQGRLSGGARMRPGSITSPRQFYFPRGVKTCRPDDQIPEIDQYNLNRLQIYGDLDQKKTFAV